MKILHYLTAKPARFFLLAALLWAGLMCYLNYKDRANFQWHDILVEANGMVFDLLVFGVLLSVYDEMRQKREKTERLQEEIDDYRRWDDPEAMYRIVGIVKRLNTLGVSAIKLDRCFLVSGKLKGAQLKKASLLSAQLSNCGFQGADLSLSDLVGIQAEKAVFNDANLEAANLRGANLKIALFENTNLFKANLKSTNLEGAYLVNAHLKQSNMQFVKLTGAVVPENWFELLASWKVEGFEEIQKTYQIKKVGSEFHIFLRENQHPPIQ